MSWERGYSLTMLVYMREVYLRQGIYLHPYPPTHSAGQYKWCNLVGEAWKSTFTQVAPLAPLTSSGHTYCKRKEANQWLQQTVGPALESTLATRYNKQ